ncbi:MAG: [protein-PII] uridylyltransferase [Gammaproteobacteria bacterium]|jgi:[protein-PII] uridylyltransferase|nr:[protein-PII] uridylyltransferase [Gammaproteobacteria bacterium]
MSALLLTRLHLEDIKPNTPSSEIVAKIRQKWSKACALLDMHFWQGQNILDLLYNRAVCLDELLLFAWQKYQLHLHEDVCLIAVGGYGQMRIHPGSDADILILIPSMQNNQLNQQIEQFVAFCWDCGIKLGLSVRTTQECLALAREDISIFTNLLTFRMLTGRTRDFNELQTDITDQTLWTFERFFAAKLQERESRQSRYQHTEYLLEPNIKDSLGGLRDISLIHWLMIKKYHQDDIKTLVKNQDLNEDEYDALNKASQFLLRIRYALHLIATKTTDRLYFEYQEILAHKFGFQGKTLNKTLSLFMQAYFQNITCVRDITDLLCQHYKEEITQIADKQYIKIDETAVNKSEYLFNLFLQVAKNKANGFCAGSSRLIIQYMKTSPPDYFSNPQAQEMFLHILQADFCATSIALMHRLGVLQRFIPTFASISGQMQYDLFHLYTVDAHTLLVLHNIQFFYQHETFEKFELLSSCKNNKKREILYLSALFHDIGKGQGGDHSKIGATIVLQFCKHLSLNDEDSSLVSWLVSNHLLMSMTAQSKDIFDDKVIANFVNIVKTPQRLGYLYLLTVADIVATNPTLWNHWRAALLQDLYLATIKKFEDKNHPQTTRSNNIDHIKQKIIDIGGFDAPLVEALWQDFHDEYFTNETLSNIAWQTNELLKSKIEQKAFTIALRTHQTQVGTEILIYATENVNLFASICATMEKVFLNIVQARITTTRNHYSLQSFIVLDISGTPITGPQRLSEIRHSLEMLLKPLTNQTSDLKIPFVSRHVPRNLKFFSMNTKIRISATKSKDKTIIKMDAPDFPGLLARIGETFVKNNVILHSAKINTLGNKVEDVFYISDPNTHGAIIDPVRLHQLKAAILEAVSKHSK